GVTQGSEISVKFDPMLAKLIAYGESRDAAIDRLTRALADYTILGTTTNLGFLRRVIAHPAFREGKVSTRFLGDHANDLRVETPEVVPQIANVLAALGPASAGHDRQKPVHARSLWDVIALTPPARERGR
ncbi:MAG TPA: acetyl-CoA carboxylase biotin carboxylase subunit, partial [Thermoanaerobaculia bacterium]|nr:acetyl-CoA carboxylase biotin carboxylase subunit [Thermoanaerobaculia bacterium]